MGTVTTLLRGTEQHGKCACVTIFEAIEASECTDTTSRTHPTTGIPSRTECSCGRACLAPPSRLQIVSTLRATEAPVVVWRVVLVVTTAATLGFVTRALLKPDTTNAIIKHQLQESRHKSGGMLPSRTADRLEVHRGVRSTVS